MTTAPTAQEFLAMQSTEDDVELEHVSPLESIAESLRMIAVGMGGEVFSAELVQESPSDRLQEAFDDLEDKHRSLFDLLAEVERIVKPSTSKVSLDVKAAIDRWKSPEVPTTEQVEAETVPVENAAEMGLPQPDHDADAEVWRAYARQLGHGRTGPAFNELNQMNRSQIRTMLGIEQPSAGA